MFLVFAAYSGTLFDFLVGVGPKLDPISFYPHLSLPTGRDRLIQREICSLLSSTSEKHSVGLTHATVRGSLSKLVLTMAKAMASPLPLSQPPFICLTSGCASQSWFTHTPLDLMAGLSSLLGAHPWALVLYAPPGQ